MSKYVATILRTTAQCGITGDVQPSAAKAIRSAELKAGRLFILGRSVTTHEDFGPDKTQFMEEATKRTISAMRKRKTKVERYSLSDSAHDCTLVVKRITT